MPSSAEPAPPKRAAAARPLARSAYGKAQRRTVTGIDASSPAPQRSRARPRACPWLHPLHGPPAPDGSGYGKAVERTVMGVDASETSAD